MALQSCLSIYSPFAKKLEMARQIKASRPRKEMTEEAKLRQRAKQKAWHEKRRSENLAQRALIESKLQAA
ncbi:hypothetical protein [Hydrogenophaga pseudoflava]|uniref:hypothetical protein n=1 Tax=Hydrogenophaga pseudoflava TaxID=47421 RepID=UPI0027E59B41|nr:hypothetical protein [Hydrogenophaga pseudoflava]MDQ7745432.1 hypothetical protein [Hydrogenophaga pseudoflava]